MLAERGVKWDMIGMSVYPYWVNNTDKQVQDRVEFNLWCLPPLFVLIIAFLTAEWIFRKRASLV